MRAVFFGTSEFAVPSLQAAGKHAQVLGVVTQPDRPAGRGHKRVPTPVKRAALELGLPVHEPESLREFARSGALAGCDLFVVASYGKILPPELLGIPRLGALNVHPSLLPAYRGATPIRAALLNGDAHTGVTIMLMDAGMDTGDVVLAQSVAIDADETYGELHDRLALLGARMLEQVFERAHAGELAPQPQRGEPSVTRRLQRADLEIDWTQPARCIVDKIRALSPAPLARAEVGGVPVKLVRARAAPRTPEMYETQLGSAIGTKEEALLLICADGILEVLEVIAPNRGKMSGYAFAQSAGIA